MTEAPAPRRAKQLGLHMLRVLLFASVLFFIHRAQAALETARALEPKAPVELEELIGFFPQAASLSEADSRGRREVFDSAGEALGSFVRTSPLADDVIGFCGPTDTLVAFDPEAAGTTRAAFERDPLAGPGALRYAESAYGAADGADALVIATEWPEFRRPDLEKVRGLLAAGPGGAPLVFDGRNVFDPEHMAEAGFEYHSVGRPHVAPQSVEDNSEVAP